VTVSTPDSGLESLERRFDSIVRVVPYLVLAVPLLPYLLTQRPTAGAFGITVGLAAAAVAWITWLTTLHPGWAERRWLMRLYVAGLLAFIAALTARSPWYGFFTWFGFLAAFRYRHRFDVSAFHFFQGFNGIH